MIDIDVEMDTSWYHFTNFNWIKKKLNDSSLKYTDDYKAGYLCIIDRDDVFEKDASQYKLRISIDELSNDVDCFISSEHILDYLDLLQKSISDDYLVTMANMNDIREVSKGALIEYVKINLKGVDDLDGLEELRKTLKGSNSNYGVLLFVTVGLLKRFEAYPYAIQDLYPNAGIIIMIPTGSIRDTGLDYKEKYAQVFAFKNEKSHNFLQEYKI